MLQLTDKKASEGLLFPGAEYSVGEAESGPDLACGLHMGVLQPASPWLAGVLMAVPRLVWHRDPGKGGRLGEAGLQATEFPLALTSTEAPFPV